MEQGRQDARMGRIIARTWADDEFRKKLLSDPAAVLRAEGMPIPAGMVFRVVEDTEKVCHLVLPVRADTWGELSDADLDKVSGGAGPVYGRRTPTGTSQYS